MDPSAKEAPIARATSPVQGSSVYRPPIAFPHQRGLAWLEAWLFTGILLSICLFGAAALRLIGAPSIAVIVFLSAVYARRYLFHRNNSAVLMFTCLGIIYVGFSYFEVFPRAWTRYHTTQIIPQQAAYVFSLLPFIAATQKWWEDPLLDRYRDRLVLLMAISTLVLSIPVGIVLYDRAITDLRALATLQNDLLIALVCLSYLTLYRGRHVVIDAVPWIFLLLTSGALLSHIQSAATYAIVLCFYAISLAKLPIERFALGALLSALLALAVYGITYPESIFKLDPNSGWRMLFWRDGLDAVAQTWGLGIGFGTESLRNEYWDVHREFFLPIEDGGFLLTGTHNGFIDTAMRLGVLGVTLFCIIIAKCYPLREMPSRLRAHCATVFALMMLSLYTNVALQSALYFFGIAFCIAYLQSARQRFEVARCWRKR